jgi:hypothetical protein
VELNIVMACNLACPDCNRLCHLRPADAGLVDPAAIASFIDKLSATGARAERVKVAGGEPLLHPAFAEIAELLAAAVDAGLVGSVKVDTNGVLPPPPGRWRRAVRLGGRPPRLKAHLPVFASPTDLGLASTPCRMPYRCGFSLDPRGWLPCSGAVPQARLLGMADLYRAEPPTAVWGLDRLCAHCPFSGPAEWRAASCLPLADIPSAGRPPTPTWAAALKHRCYDG